MPPHVQNLMSHGFFPRIIVAASFALGALTASAGELAKRPAWLLSIPDSVTTVLVADTSSATLYEYSFAAGSQIAEAEHYMSIGQNGIQKERAGDRRTPLGIYFITEQLDTSRLHEKNGTTAFPLDYPNTLDREAGRTGDGIWLHGVTPGPERRPERDTDGCIAIPNEDLTALATRLDLLDTPVIVATEMQYASPVELAAEDREITALVKAWGGAQATGNVLDYLSLYADDFRYRGLTHEEWAQFRTEQFLARSPPTLEIRDLLVLRDPVDASIVMTRFVIERQNGDGNTLTGRKRLYWQKQSDSRYRIVAEDNG